MVKVPPAYGGKRIKCVRCEGIIVIPKPVDVPGELLSDDMLPEVARDEDILRGAPLEIPVAKSGQEAPPPPPSPPPASETRRRTRPGRGYGAERGSSRMTRSDRGGTRLTRGPKTKSRRKSNLPLILGIVIGGVVLVALVVIIAVTTSGPASSKAPGPEEVAPVVSDDPALRGRCSKFLRAYRDGNLVELKSFCRDDELKMRIGSFVESAALDGNSFVKEAKEDGTVTFGTASGGEVTIRWVQSGGEWYIQSFP